MVRSTSVSAVGRRRILFPIWVNVVVKPAIYFFIVVMATVVIFFQRVIPSLSVCLFQCESHDIIVSETPSDGDTNPTPSQVIDDFDSNDIIFDEAAIKVVRLQYFPTISSHVPHSTDRRIFSNSFFVTIHNAPLKENWRISQISLKWSQ